MNINQVIQHVKQAQVVCAFVSKQDDLILFVNPKDLTVGYPFDRDLVNSPLFPSVIQGLNEYGYNRLYIYDDINDFELVYQAGNNV